MMSLALELSDDVTSQTQMSRARDCWHCHRAWLGPSAAIKQMIHKPRGQTLWTTAPDVCNVILSALFLPWKRSIISSTMSDASTTDSPVLHCGMVRCTACQLELVTGMSWCQRWFLLWEGRAFPLLGCKLHSEAAENSARYFTGSNRGEAAPLPLSSSPSFPRLPLSSSLLCCGTKSTVITLLSAVGKLWQRDGLR